MDTNNNPNYVMDSFQGFYQFDPAGASLLFDFESGAGGAGDTTTSTCDPTAISIDKLADLIDLEEVRKAQEIKSAQDEVLSGLHQQRMMDLISDSCITKVETHRFFTPFIDAKERVIYTWKVKLGSDSKDICAYLTLEEAIAHNIELKNNPKLAPSDIEQYDFEIKLMREFRDNLDFNFVTIMNMLEVYKKLIHGSTFSHAIEVACLKSKRVFSTEELKEELLYRIKLFFNLFVVKFEQKNSNDEMLTQFQHNVFTIFGSFTWFTPSECFQCFPCSFLDKYLDMVSDPTLNDYYKMPMIRFLKTLAEKSPREFYDFYYDTMFNKRNLFESAPQHTVYWVNILYILSKDAPSEMLRFIAGQLAILANLKLSDTQKEVSALTMMDCLSQIMTRQGREFVIANSDVFNVNPKHFRSISTQKQYYKLQNEVEQAISGAKTSPISIYMKALEKTSNNNSIFIVEFNGTKKKMSMLDECGYSDLLTLIEEKFSVDRNDVLINIFDQDCRDYVELDPSEHDFKKMAQPIKIRMAERVEKQEITESSIISSIDQYKISRHLKSDGTAATNTSDLISMTFLAEEIQLNKEVRKIAIKYFNFKGNKAEGNLSEQILTLKKVKEFEKSNLVPIYDILKPESINKQKVKKVHHLAFTMPYYNHGSVATLMKEKVSLSTRMILSLLKYSLEGFNSLEEARFEYGNIKEENLMIETLDLSSGTIRVRISDWWIVSKSKVPAISFLGATIYRLLTFEKLDVTSLMSEDFTKEKIAQQIQQRQNKSGSSTLSIAIEIIGFLLGKSGSSIPITARNGLKILYKRVKEVKEKQ